MRVRLVGSEDLDQRTNVGCIVLSKHDAHVRQSEGREHRKAAANQVGNRCSRVGAPRPEARAGEQVVGAPAGPGDFRDTAASG
jgi:hypothetical protein